MLAPARTLRLRLSSNRRIHKVVVTSIIVTTIIVFILVDILLRTLLTRFRAAQDRKEREQALDIGLKLDVSEEAPTLTRVELDSPKARILAVDDEKIILDSLRKMLVLGGYSIDTVESGKEALGLVSKRDYDFVFTDLKMPGMDGVEVTKAVRHLRPDIDVIVVTGYGTIESAVETVQYGAMDYVEKPFTEDELLAFVKTALIKRQARLEKQVRHKVRLVKPGIGESKSRFELNVPAGAFISQQHAWARIELNGAVRIGLDDLIRKIFRHVDSVNLPETGRKIARGETLFSITYGDYSLDIPSPISGTVISVNSEHAEHPEWLAIKPFELSWMCRVEPSNLAAELPDLKIGHDAIDWYQAELDRYSQLARNGGADAAAVALGEPDDGGPEGEEERLKILARFSEPFLKS
ncbi:MAG: response regulator [Gammaproteobacteria bacterium]|nr:response regulator [Gammaproteobacteria bacterium]